MNTTNTLLQHDESSGFLRRAGRAVLGSAAILVVGAGAAPAAQAATGGSVGGAPTAHHSSARSGPTALPTETRTAAARFVVTREGKLARSD